MSFTCVAKIAAVRLMSEKVMAGTGYGISAKIGENMVTDLATILHTPIVVVANTSGNRSKWARYRRQNCPAAPKVDNSSEKGITLSL